MQNELDLLIAIDNIQTRDEAKFVLSKIKAVTDKRLKAQLILSFSDKTIKSGIIVPHVEY